jgi:predicted metal-dependent hydrolase
VEAKLRGDELKVYLPAGLPRAEEERWVTRMKARFERRKKDGRDDEYLEKRAAALNRRYFGGKLEFKSIKYVANQNSRFGSCTHKNGTIRISHRLKAMPGWVRDYVIVHELAHLLYPDHSKAFWKAVNQYKYTERARGFLIAMSMEDEVQ